MADLSITAASVVPGANAIVEHGTAGETITAGHAVYKDTTTGKYIKADANSATAAARQARGIALNGASDGQPLTIQKSGDITLGAVLVAGTDYYLSDTPGGVAPRADIGAGEYVCLLGLAKTASVLALDIQFPNVAL
jgi:hypothetical protein